VIFTSGLLKADFLEFNKKFQKCALTVLLSLKLPGHISASFVKLILHSEMQTRRRSGFKSENREIRRFLPVPQTTRAKLKNVLSKTTLYSHKEVNKGTILRPLPPLTLKFPG
jgi:hypothetical protein